jgi:hypothetical protein
MKKTIAAIAITLALAGSAFAKDKPKPTILSHEEVMALARHAVSALPALQASMKDPDSFVLETVYVTAPKSGGHAFCYVYRSRNSYGGYSGTSVARLNSHDILDSFAKASDISLFNFCTQDTWSHQLNITEYVNAVLHPPAPEVPPPASPEDAAKKAQQYADCLKLAVDNPKIVCKQ